jgi:hypothetical protein
MKRSNLINPTPHRETGTVAEYVAALKASAAFGPQVVEHRTIAAVSPVTVPPDHLADELRQILLDKNLKKKDLVTLAGVSSYTINKLV